jgi:hypothetical protein
VFCKKSPQAIENKGKRSGKERKEKQRVAKLLKIWDLPERHRNIEVAKPWTETLEGDTPGVLYGCENKRVAGIGICIVVKTKGRQMGLAQGVNGGRDVEEDGGAGEAEILWKAWLGRRFHAEG